MLRPPSGWKNKQLRVSKSPILILRAHLVFHSHAQQALSVAAMRVSVAVATGAQQGRQTFGGSLHQKSLLMGQWPFHQFRNIVLIRPQSVLRMETLHPCNSAKV